MLSLYLLIINASKLGSLGRVPVKDNQYKERSRTDTLKMHFSFIDDISRAGGIGTLTALVALRY